MNKLALAAAAAMAFGGAILLTQKPWQNTTTASDAGEAIPFEMGKNGGDSKADCSTPLRDIKLAGATQLDPISVLHDAPLLEGKPFEMGAALKLMRHVREKYRHAGREDPVLSLQLDSVCEGILVVAVTEAGIAGPYTPPAAVHIARAPEPQPEQPYAAQPARQGLASLLGSVANLIYDGGARLASRFNRSSQGSSEAVGGHRMAGGAGNGRGEGTYPAAADEGGYGASGEYGEEIITQNTWGDGAPDTSNTPLSGGMTDRPEDDMLFLDMLLNGRKVINSMTAYLAEEPGQVWLPLGALVKALGFPIQVDPGAGIAEGWFLNEGNDFRLNSGAQSMVLAGKILVYPQGKIEVHDEDIYVHSSVLAEWFPLDLVMNFNELRLIATSRVPLPNEERLARSRNWEEMERARKAAELALLEKAQALPYSLATMPTIRLDGSINAQHTSTRGNTWGSGLSMQAEGDMLYSTGNLTLSGQREQQTGDYKLSGANLTLRRQEISSTLLGPLKATTLLAGDIDTVAQPLSTVKSQGRGVRVNNQPFGFVDDPDRFVITGPAPVGWDVEVYQNQSLLAFQRVGPDGRYRFTALPLRTGVNDFKVVQYGPQGERRESIERYNLGEGMLAQGQATYDVSVYQPGKSLLPVQAGPLTSTTEPWLLATRFDYGISRYLSANVGSYGLAQAGGEPGRKSGQGVTAGLRGSYKAVFAKADVLVGADGERALGLSGRVRLTDRTDARAGYTTRNGFDRTEQPVKDSYELGLDNFSHFGKVGLNSSIGYVNKEFTHGGKEQSLQQRTGLSYARWSLTNTLERTWLDDGDVAYRGQADMSTSYKRVRVRGSMNYHPLEDQVMRQVSVNAQAPVAERLVLDSTLSHRLGNDSYTQLQNTLRYDLGDFSLGLQGHTSTEGDYGMGMTLSTMLVPQDGTDYKLAHPSYGSGLSKALVHVFVDGNANGVFDKGEKPVAKVTVRNRSRGTSHVTDANGIALVDNLPAYSPVKLSLEDDSLPDIFLKPQKEEVVLVSHPGANGTIAYPMTQFGEVAGTLYASAREGDKTVVRPVGQLTLELVDAKGKIVDSIVSENDGYFAISPIALGTYTLRLKKDEAAEAGYSLKEEITISLTAERNSVDNLDVGLEQGALPQGASISGSQVIE